MTKQPKYRRPLNPEQIKHLELLYRFRFATTEQIARYFNKPKSMYVYKRITILLDQGYIDRRYDNSYKIQGKPAVYYLLPKGSNFLLDADLKIVYKTKSLSDEYAYHSVKVLDVYLDLIEQYGDNIRFITNVELQRLEYIPKRLVDTYITFKDKSNKQFLILIDDKTPKFVLNRKLKNIINYYDSRDWVELSDIFPSISFICSNNAINKWLVIRIENLTEDEGLEDIEFIFTG